MNDFEGLRALVTGGAGGIGLAVADELATRGARVAVLDRAFGTALADHLAVTSDITDDAAVRAAVDEAVRTFGGLDILVNNAGIGAIGGIADNDDEEWHRVYDVNVVGIARVTRAALPALRKSSTGSIVNTASVAATSGLKQRALYSATKGAVIALTYAMAADLLAEKIRVNAVAPGTADTPWVQRLVSQSEAPEATAAALMARQPLGRLVSPGEVAFAICNLASPKAASTTGTVLTVDGGLTTLRV